MEFIWFWLGGVYAFLMSAMVADALRHKTPWRELAPAAAFGAAMIAALGGLVQLTVSWVEQSGWSGVLAVIGLLCMLFSLSCALIGGVLRALYRD